MKTLLNFENLEILVLDEARIGDCKLRLSDNWKASRVHGGVEKLIANRNGQ